MALLFFSLPLSASALSLESDTLRANAGYYQLKWQDESAPADIRYELYESQQPDFSQSRLIYAGPDLASVISGKRNGDYYYRVTTADQTSNSVKVEVAHHSLNEAFAVFSLGLLVFIATLMLILFASRRSEEHL